MHRNNKTRSRIIRDHETQARRRRQNKMSLSGGRGLHGEGPCTKVETGRKIVRYLTLASFQDSYPESHKTVSWVRFQCRKCQSPTVNWKQENIPDDLPVFRVLRPCRADGQEAVVEQWKRVVRSAACPKMTHSPGPASSGCLRTSGCTG